LWTINDVRLWWYEAADVKADIGEIEWIGERRLRAEMSIVKKHPDHIPATIRISQGMIPDAVVVGAHGVDAIEVELTPKKPAELQEKLRRLCHSVYEEVATGNEYVYNHVCFYVPNKAMQQHVERASMHLPEAERERVEIFLDEKLQPSAKR
jgi:predicted house-cleaning NTP pyrophosphatase (Maf/HAM1 superfamily)